MALCGLFLVHSGIICDTYLTMAATVDTSRLTWWFGVLFTLFTVLTISTTSLPDPYRVGKCCITFISGHLYAVIGTSTKLITTFKKMGSSCPDFQRFYTFSPLTLNILQWLFENPKHQTIFLSRQLFNRCYPQSFLNLLQHRHDSLMSLFTYSNLRKKKYCEMKSFCYAEQAKRACKICTVC